MRFCPVSSEFWVQESRDLIESCGGVISLAMMYCLKSYHTSNMIGVYQISLQTLSREIGASITETKECFELLILNGYIEYDYKHEYVWVKSVVYEQIFQNYSYYERASCSLKSLDNKAKGVCKIISALPNLCFIPDFISEYKDVLKIDKSLCDALLERASKGLRRGFEGASKGIDKPLSRGNEFSDEGASKGVDKQVRSKKEEVRSKKEETNTQLAAASFSKSKKTGSSKRVYALIDEQSNEFKEIYNFWLNEMGDSILCNIGKDNQRIHSKYAVCEADVQRVEEALSDFSIDECKKMIAGCKSSEYHMQNGHYSLFTIFRDITTRRTHLEKFEKKGAKPAIKTAQEKQDENLRAIYNRFKDEDD